MILHKEELGDYQGGFDKIQIGDSHCIQIDKREQCFRFVVEDKVVCAFFFGLEGKPFEVNRLTLEGCSVIHRTPYPACAPMIILDEGEERIFTKPGCYEICSCDGEPLPKNFKADWRGLSECQAKVSMAEAHMQYIQQRDCELKIERAS